METLALASDGLTARLSTQGGRILSLDWRMGGTTVPLLHRCDETGPEARSAFPLVPFANRLAGNAFRFRGEDVVLAPNTADPAYLHGDGWLGTWAVEAADGASARLVFRHEGEPYRYEARLGMRLEDGAGHLALEVRNTGGRPLPFGLGWHPFLPRTPETKLELRAHGFRAERPGHLPGEEAPLPADLDFASAAPLPGRWVNNGLEDWDGRARILWPERSAGLLVEADPLFAHAFLFLPDRALAPRADWFCLEPMSHRAGAHHHADLGGLRALAPGETLSGALRLSPFSLRQGASNPS
ncbi:aldose 1-epimerase [Aureimonas endophytica]|uniref:Aldose 1-epimerase n=1 Tax=Aureimonas endophytica TaxID=2027858 RepID=A0A916ZNH4_9HYPH|nr:aldose 1-epimerase [Aureimonas endophytica]GGE05362.1 aldose 1-epimerase [Aureimonas endophytica]